MNLPKVVTDLVQAQDNFDSAAYANCFTETAVVFDEGKTYNGKTEIKDWNERSNKEYQTKMEILETFTEDETIILRANVSGAFDGSPITLKFHFKMVNDKISELKITD